MALPTDCFSFYILNLTLMTIKKTPQQNSVFVGVSIELTKECSKH